MKPLVIHLIGDKLTGGSNLYVKRLVTSCLNKKYDFLISRLNEFKVSHQSRKPNLIVFHYPCTWQYLIKLIVLKRHSKLVILDHHYCLGFEQDQVSSLWRFHLMLKLAYSIADRVVCVSYAQKRWILSRGLVNPDKLRVIQVSVSGAVTIEDLLTITPKKPQKPLILGAYGRFAHQKGFDTLLKAIALLPARDFFLYLGGYGFEADSLAKLAQDLPHVKLIGAVTDIPAFLNLCDVVVIPSRWETGSIVCMEGKAAGKPIIASNIDSFPELIDDYGLLVPLNNVEQLAHAIASLPEKDLISWGQAARKSMIGSWQKFLTDWENLLEEVVQ